MAKVDADLYDFLQNNETGMFYDAERKQMVAYVHVYFFNLEELVEILGEYYFDEGGRDAQIFRNTVCIDLQEIFKSEGNCILDYKNCFSEDDIENYRQYLEEEAE